MFFILVFVVHLDYWILSTFISYIYVHMYITPKHKNTVKKGSSIIDSHILIYALFFSSTADCTYCNTYNKNTTLLKKHKHFIYKTFILEYTYVPYIEYFSTNLFRIYRFFLHCFIIMIHNLQKNLISYISLIIHTYEQCKNMCTHINKIHDTCINKTF